MTHTQLVDIARRWLVQVKRCSVVTTEIKHQQVCESPDALGWDYLSSHLIEVKATRADFLSDRKKPFRINSGQGMGCHRWYLAPQGVIFPEDLPSGWGLLEVPVGKKTPRVVRDSQPQEYNAKAETLILISLLRRGAITAPGVNIRVFTIEVYQQDREARTTMCVQPEQEGEA